MSFLCMRVLHASCRQCPRIIIAVQTKSVHAIHARCECETRHRARSAPALARPAEGFRGGRAPAVDHARRHGAAPHAVRGEPADPRPRGPARREAVPSPASRARADRGGAAALSGRGADPCHHAWHHRSPARARRAPRAVGDHHALVRRAVADPALAVVRATASRRRRAHPRRRAPAGPRARGHRLRDPLRHGGARRRRRGPPVRRERVPGVQPGAGARREASAARARRPAPPRHAADRRSRRLVAVAELDELARARRRAGREARRAAHVLELRAGGAGGDPGRRHRAGAPAAGARRDARGQARGAVPRARRVDARVLRARVLARTNEAGGGRVRGLAEGRGLVGRGAALGYLQDDLADVL